MNKIITLIQCYAENLSALSVSKRLGTSYVSIQKHYEIFRFLSAKICEEEYEELADKQCEYEEYFYLESSKKLKREAIFDAHNFLSFDYDEHIYTLIMPSLHIYKTQMIEDQIEDSYINEFKKFKRENKIIKVSKRLNNIVRFWEYFEKSIVKYKGVNNDKFAYFLKEFEFKYNHSKDDTINLLIQAYFKVSLKR
ncbi:MAG: transposase [Helicobacteraceae bacterium]|nr:transposase [Candidatus Sulfurimonas ponti]